MHTNGLLSGLTDIGYFRTAWLPGELPTVEEYMQYAKQADSMSSDICRYLSFDKIGEYTEQADKINVAQRA